MSSGNILYRKKEEGFPCINKDLEGMWNLWRRLESLCGCMLCKGLFFGLVGLCLILVVFFNKVIFVNIFLIQIILLSRHPDSSLCFYGFSHFTKVVYRYSLKIIKN